MALEVEEIEKTKGEEKETLVAQIDKLERLCNFYKQTSTKQANALKKLSDVAKQLAKEQSTSSAAHRKELTDMGYVEAHRMSIVVVTYFHPIRMAQVSDQVLLPAEPAGTAAGSERARREDQPQVPQRDVGEEAAA